MTKQFKKKVSSFKYFGNSVQKKPQRFIPFPVKERMLRAFLCFGLPEQDRSMAELIPLMAMQDKPPELITVCVGQYHRGFQEIILAPDVIRQCALEGYSARRVANVLNALEFQNEHGVIPALSIDVNHTDVIVPLYSTLGFVAQAAHIVTTGQDIQAGIFQYPKAADEA